MLISQPQIAPSLLRGPGQLFVARFGKQIGGTFYPSTAYAAQAADVLLDAIARSNGTRASVTRALFATHVRNGITGSFAFTPSGDTTAGSVTIIRVEHGQPVPVSAITQSASLPEGG
jgi:ABC-type branched-subunit amino acid transport system substrate-binding protein